MRLHKLKFEAKIKNFIIIPADARESSGIIRAKSVLMVNKLEG